MEIKVEFVEENIGVVETYTVPDGTWLQPKHCGMQYIPPVMKQEVIDTLYQSPRRNRVYMILVPNKVPSIPEELLRVVNGKDKKWGKNGYEWLGNNREKQGGTAIDRVRELVWKYSWIGDFPVDITAGEIEQLKKELE